MAVAGVTNPLVPVAELRELLGSVTVLDVRYRTAGASGPEEYRAGHVPGAAYVDLDADLAAPAGSGGRHPLPDTTLFETAMRRVGVSGERPVVVYDDWSGHAAARAWWLLRFHGHLDVRVLDGGWAAWVAAGGPVETGELSTDAAVPGDFTASPGHLPVVEAADVPSVAVLVDARAPERYRGETEPIDPVAGHVPGAVNVPTSSNLGADGRFRTAAELREVYAAVGATVEAGERGEVAAYCGSGVTAAHDVLAMEAAGIRAALYPGSWSGWVADPSRPVERAGGLVLRPASPADAPGLVCLAEEVWPAAYSFDLAFASVTIATWWTEESTLASIADTDWLVVTAGGEPVAAGNIDLRQDPPVVWKLLVHPARQGRGLGSLVLRELVRRSGAERVRLSYVEGNDPAAAFYRRLGFVEVEREPAEGDRPAHVVVELVGPVAATG